MVAICLTLRSCSYSFKVHDNQTGNSQTKRHQNINCSARNGGFRQVNQLLNNGLTYVLTKGFWNQCFAYGSLTTLGCFETTRIGGDRNTT